MERPHTTKHQTSSFIRLNYERGAQRRSLKAAIAQFVYGTYDTPTIHRDARGDTTLWAEVGQLTSFSVIPTDVTHR